MTLSTHVSFLPQTPLPTRLPCNIEQSPLCSTAGPCCLSILNVAVCTCPSQLSLPTILPPGNHKFILTVCESISVVPCGSDSKESACSVGDLGLIPWLGRSPGEGKGYPLQYSGLEKSMGCLGLQKSQTWLSNFHFQVQLSKNCGEEMTNSIFFFFFYNDDKIQKQKM